MTARTRTFACAMMTFALSQAVHADYLWLQRDGDAMVARIGELERPRPSLPALLDAKALVAGGGSQAVQTEADRYTFAATPTDARISAMLPSGERTLTIHQARFGRTETHAVNDLELVPTEPGGNTFKLIWKGTTVSASQVNVDTSEGWHRVLRPAKDGTVTLTTPFPGLYVLEVSARINDGSVSLGGKKYDDVRHTATLSFDVPR